MSEPNPEFTKHIASLAPEHLSLASSSLARQLFEAGQKAERARCEAIAKDDMLNYDGILIAIRGLPK